MRKSAKRKTVKPGSQGMNWIRQEKREALYLRAEQAMGKRCCTYCVAETKAGRGGGKRPNTPTLDHIIPHVLGGPNSEDNLILACLRCNKLKQDLPLAKFVAVLEAMGLNPKKIYKRIKAQISRKIDVAAGKASLQARKIAAVRPRTKRGGR